MRLPPIAQNIQRLLSETPNGLTIDELLDQIKIINPYIKLPQLQNNLERFSEAFSLQEDKWRLRSIVENEHRTAEVNNRINSTNLDKVDDTGKKESEKGNSTSYSVIRDNYIETMFKDLIGPKNGRDETIKERPNVYYLGGMLYPANVEVEDIEPVELYSDTDEKTDTQNRYITEQEEDDDEIAANQNRFHQSSIGMTCNVAPEVKNVSVNITYGKYEETKEDKKKVYQRFERNQTGTIDLAQNKGFLLYEDENLELLWLVKKKDEKTFLSVFLVNRYNDGENADVPVEHIIFQPCIRLTSPVEGEMPFLRRDHGFINQIEDEDMERSQLLYRNKADFAVGHGCAVEWKNYSLNRAGSINTTFMPTYEIPAVEHLELKGMSGLDMYVLSYIEDGAQLRKQLNPLVDAYEAWIEKQKAIDVPEHEKQKQKLIQSCSEALQRMRQGIEIVCDDKGKAFKAFKIANEMMLYQRAFSERAKHFRTTGEFREDLELSGRWRPFQLAFILLNLKGIVDPTSEERDLVDLLWFPTGGGKTEAYLGLAAFVMSLRRLNGVPEGIDSYAGTTVLMRYTLRLLTIQQFQRASALICAAEYLRSKDPNTWGKESFSIGLWVGGGTTPNMLVDGDDSAKEALDKLQEGKKVYGGNPIQLHNCPCCGAELTPERYRIEQKVFTIHCPNEKCFFHKQNIPAYTVDEAIYYMCPTILIGTVDKFARLPWTGKIGPLFGKVDRYCERHGFIREGEDHAKSHNSTQEFPRSQTVDISNLLPPELIIQDELHLISGPLGSMVGLYETAVDYLSAFETNGVKVQPKVVASTATIRRASDQVGGIFNREVRQFPPSGINAEDSFFSYEVTGGSKPGRKYVGLYFPGSSGKTSLVRIYADLLQKGQELKLKGEDIDPYYTLAGYFNSLRELGGTLRLVEDDIPDRIKYLVEEKGQRRFIKNKEELTSRIDATEIPAILNKLEQPAGTEEAVDVLLATNMISVGVDIDRLGMMVVTGQPKGTSEYIQATSRVGRKYPGLVFTLYNWSRPRDISHYEQFISYHSKFYSYVEATSVTPFSYRARDKGLKAIVVGMLRQLDSQLHKNSSAKDFDLDNGYLNDIKNYIIARGTKIDEIDSGDIEEEIDSILKWWSERAQEDPDQLSYQQYNFTPKDTPVLFRSINQDIKNAALIPDSLRDVEAEVDVFYTYLMDEED
ncbi:DISARM system helicase DrmA [Bacillus salipaludis]|uniref:DISARM system helicase DrmA n=1 Tax=Bacillus salipaludis TaxID=2547811 RepID=A0AA90QXP1_9BACI|nr:DISARM system helicase DrmA [Bacillus salipaludis]MDQ6598104.1 DISARM system helicase DrmA [Bacillus salipaludis]